LAAVTITDATISHALSATGADDPTAEVQMKHWNSTHAASVVLAAAAVVGLFSNLNGMSFGTTDGAITGSYTVPTQSVQTQAAGAIARSGFTTTTIAGDVVAGTLNTDGLKIAIPAYLTAAEGAPGGAGTGFTTTTVGGDVVAGTLNSDGLKIAVPAYLTTYAAQTVQTQASGNIPRTGFTTTATAGTEVVGTHNTDGLKLGVPAYLTTAQAPGAYLTTARGSTDAIGLNTAKTNVTWTVNSSGLSFNAEGYAGTGTSATNASITLNSAGLAISVAAPGGGADKTASYIEIADGGRFTSIAPWNNATFSQRPIFVPFKADFALASCRSIRLFASRTGGTSLAGTIHAGIYTLANSTSMNLVSSTSLAVSFTTSAMFSGIRVADLTGLSGLSLSPGHYVLGVMASIPATVSWGLGLVGGDAGVFGGFFMGGTTTAATASGSHILPFWGVWNATSAGLPSAVAASSISGGNGVNSPDIYAVLKAI
jgi:hypothetical protein